MDVALFITCLTDTFFPHVGEAVVRVLRHYGCRVHFPAGQTCCGQPAYNSGFRDDAAAAARHLLETFAGFPAVVSPSSSCAVMIRQHIPELLADDPVLHARALALAAATHDFTGFVSGPLGVDIGRVVRLNAPTTFHFPCHARPLHGAGDLQRWLSCGENAAACRAPAHPDLCCGFGGMFAVDYAELSNAMLTDKLAEIAATGAETVVCNEAACALQILGGAHRRQTAMRLRHVAELMVESLGLPQAEQTP